MAETGTARAPDKSAAEPAMTPANPAATGRHEIEEDTRWNPVLDLPCEFMVDLPLPGFRIADLLKLRQGSLINAHWRTAQDVPLHLNGKLVGWGEFEVMGNSLAVRLTELV